MVRAPNNSPIDLYSNTVIKLLAVAAIGSEELQQQLRWSDVKLRSMAPSCMRNYVVSLAIFDTQPHTKAD